MAEMRVVPAEWFGSNPLRLAFLSGVLDDDAHAVMAIIVAVSPMIQSPG